MSMIFDRAMMDKIFHLQEAYRLTYPQIEERLGLNVGSVKVAVYRYRHGLLKFKREEWRETRKEIERLVIEGVRPVQIGRKLGRHHSSILQTLSRMGIDPEMRRQMSRSHAA